MGRFWLKKSTTHFGLWIPQWLLGLGRGEKMKPATEICWSVDFTTDELLFG
jgi:hypothetical protein